MPRVSMTPFRDRLVRLASRVRSLGPRRASTEVQEELEGARAEDLAEELARISTSDAVELLQAMDVIQAGNVLVELPTETARTIVRELPDEVVASYLDVLPMDDAIDLREELGNERFDALLEVIPDEDAGQIRRLLAYPEESVGRVMTEAFFHVRPEMTMTEILADLREAGDEKYEQVNDLYVLESDGTLIGVTSLRRVLRVPPQTLVRDIMRSDPVYAVATENEEAAARTMARYGFYALPIVDEHHRMVGLFTGDDAQAILREAETEDVLAVGAVSGDAEPYFSLSPIDLYKRRCPWLVALFVAETLTGVVMRHYSSDLGVVPLMLFVPLVIGAGGNSGAQVTTTITRAIALGEVKPGDWLSVMGKEVIVAVMNGLTLGTIGFLRAHFGWSTSLDLSLVVALALPAVVLWATTVGSVLPIGAKWVGLDPAVMSAPFITTFVDATGLVIYFEIALRLMKS